MISCLSDQGFYTEGVGQPQPRVCFETLGQRAPIFHTTLKGFAKARQITAETNPFRVPATIAYLIPGLPKLNPGLALANTFGVKTLSGKQEVVGLLLRERQTIFRAPQLVYHSSAAAITRAALPPYDPAPMKI